MEDRIRQTIDWMISQRFTLAEAYNVSAAIQNLLQGWEDQSNRLARRAGNEADKRVREHVYNEEMSLRLGDFHSKIGAIHEMRAQVVSLEEIDAIYPFLPRKDECHDGTPPAEVVQQ